MDARTADAIDSLGTLMSETAMRAAAGMIRERGLGVADVNMDALIPALRREIVAAFDRIREQARPLIESGMGGWSGTLVGVECVEAAKRALAEVGI